MTPRRVVADAGREVVPPDVRLTRIGSGTRGLVGGLVTVVAVVAVLVAKPWVTEPGSRADRDAGDPARASTAASPAAPTPAATPSTGSDAVACLVQRSWRLVTFQRDGSVEQRTWYAAQPLPAATGPDDPGVPIRATVTTPLTALGFCAPVLKPDGTPLEVTGVRFWRLDRDGEFSRLQGVRRLADSTGPNAARLYAYPPIVGTPRSWPPGTYVMAVETTGVPWWLGIRIEELPD